jgi:hypothetical protein
MTGKTSYRVLSFDMSGGYRATSPTVVLKLVRD